MVLGNRRLTIRELVDMVGISFGPVQTIMKDHLGLRRVKSPLMPKFRNLFEKERRIHEAIRKKRLEVWANNFWILYDDNAPSHNALILVSFSPKTLPMLLHNHRIHLS